MNRRELIGRSATFATVFVAGRYFTCAAEGYPFTLGVASGEPTHDGVVLWTRLAPTPLALDGSGGLSKPVSVTWDVATDDAMRNVVRTGLVEADRRFAHSVHVEVGGLEPGRLYWYRFTALGQQSPIGRTKTAPAPSAEPERMRLAFASCSNWEMGYFSAYRHMTEENPDLVIFLGDYILERFLTLRRIGSCANMTVQPPPTSPAIAIATRFIAPTRICRPCMRRPRA